MIMTNSEPPTSKTVAKRGRCRFLKVAGAVIAALATIFLVSCFYTTSYLWLINDDTGRLLLASNLNEGDFFSLSFTHSVNQSLVTETYQIQYGQIFLTALDFYAFGAGMPTELEPGQTLTYLPEGGMRIEGFERQVSSLRYLVGHIADLSLYLGSEKIPLDALDAPGQPIRISLERLNIWQRLYLGLW